MKGRITVLVGISGSGKSTWAHNEWKQNPLTTLIISRDAVRESMFGFSDKTLKQYYEHPKIFSLEKEVAKAENDLIYAGLEAGKHVIYDHNNLTYGEIVRFKFWNVETVYRTFEETLVQAILKDRSRIKQWGDETIKKQYEQFKQLVHNPAFKKLDFTPTRLINDIKKPKAICFDIDGTLAHMNGRSPYDWKRVGEDIMDYPVAVVQDYIVNSYEAPTIFITTARDEAARFETVKWLDKEGIRYDKLLMRGQVDERPDWVVKEKMWREIAEDYYIVGCFEDSTSVVRRGRALGLKMFEVQRNHY